MSDDMLAQFIVKDLDSGQSFNVSKVPTFLQESQVNTFQNTAYKYQDIVVTIVESVQEHYTSYEINVYNKKTEDKWVISRRYKEFLALQNRLKGTGQKILEDLPPKKLSASNEKVVKTRRQTLERWLNIIVATINSTNPYLSVFLEMYQQSEAAAGKAAGKLGRKFFSRVIDSTVSGEKIGPEDVEEPPEKRIIDLKNKKITVNRLSVAPITLGEATKKYPHLATCTLNTNLTLRGETAGGGVK